jgi:diguanylate cyclase (GGDEF)-like protein/prepilin-type processing-associated H-X9-DG protein
VTRQSGSHASDLRALQRRLIELDSDRIEARETVRLLVTLHAAFAAISFARGPDDVVRCMLDAAHDALRFERAAFFDRRRNLKAFVDDRDLSGPPELDGSLEPPASHIALAGLAGELNRPTVDVRNWYVLASLRSHDDRLGYLFADGHPSREPIPALLELVEALAAVSAPAMQNAVVYARTRALAARDSLTGLLNRRAFRERFEAAVAECRIRPSACACAMVDLDDLKQINDSGGHALGDAVLKHLASALTANARPSDLIGRLGGDEFALVFRDVDRELARTLVRRLCTALRAEGLRCSIGAALLGPLADDVDSLLREADRALYLVKAAGKNGYAFAPLS